MTVARRGLRAVFPRGLRGALHATWLRSRRSKLRTRITVAATLAVALGVGAGVTFAYLVVRSQLYGGIDRQLYKQAQAMQRVSFSGNPAKLFPSNSSTIVTNGAKDAAGVTGPRRHFGDAL